MKKFLIGMLIGVSAALIVAELSFQQQRWSYHQEAWQHGCGAWIGDIRETDFSKFRFFYWDELKKNRAPAPQPGKRTESKPLDGIGANARKEVL